MDFCPFLSVCVLAYLSGFCSQNSSLLQSLDEIKYEFAFSENDGDTSTSMRETHKKAVIEQLYERMNCDIQVVDHNSDEFRNIQTYLHNTGNTSGLRLVDLFRLKCHHENFRSSLGNRLLLWHGSKVANLPGILSQGLLINPKSLVERTGAIYGRGVYFADTADKSQHYCRADGFDHFLLLSDLALGRIQFTRGGDRNQQVCTKNFDSYLGGSGTLEEPGKVIQHLDGYGIPIHTAQQRRPNEYVVFNSDQVSLKYLVRARRWQPGQL